MSVLPPKPTPPETQQVLAERGGLYGSFSTNAGISQRLKRAMHDTPNWNALPAYQREALEMVQHKIARLLNGDPTYRDNPVDIIGYVTLMLEAMDADANTVAPLVFRPV